MSDTIHLYHIFFVRNSLHSLMNIILTPTSHTHFSHLFQFDPVTLDGGASWTGDMSLSAGDL